MVTPAEVTLVQSSWNQVAPISQTAADLFYGRLFELDPSLRELFPEDLSEQKKKLMQTLAVCVNGLNDLGAIVPAVQALGQRHVGYNVKDEHYDTVAAALLWTLQQGLGNDFTPEVSAAWQSVYAVLSTTMKQAAAEVTVS
jgi:hemoglobin-like flavoprotein